MILPPRFYAVRYVGKKYPGNATGLKDGANCQHFAYELMRHFGYKVPHFRSSDLWEDRRHSKRAVDMRRFDLLLFSPTRRVWGAHVAICVGKGRIAHLCKEIGRPVIWDLGEFKKRPRYRMMIGIKRMKRRGLM